MIKKVNDYDLAAKIKTGTDIQEYADVTGISVYTIEKHLVDMSEAGVIVPADILDEDEAEAAASFLGRAGWNSNLGEMYRMLEGRYSYTELKILMHSPSFLRAVEDAAGQAGKKADSVSGRRRMYEERGRNWYRKIPGIYVYFIFDIEDENRVLFIDVTKNLGKVIRDCENSASRIGYIEAGSYEEGKALAGYYTAGMKPVYPSCSADTNVITGIDETKRKPGMIRLIKERDKE